MGMGDDSKRLYYFLVYERGRVEVKEGTTGIYFLS